MNIIQLTETHFPEAIHLSEYAFQYQVPEEERKGRLERLKQHRIFGVVEDGVVAAKAHLIPFEIYLEGEPLRMGGIGSVATYPEYRRQGYVKGLLAHLLAVMKEEGQTVSMLHPFSVSFYRKYGWELITDYCRSVYAKSDLVPLQPAPDGIIRRCTKASHSADLEQVYDRFARRHAGMLKRSTDRWLHAVYGNRFAAVYYDEEKKPQGYMLYEVKESRMKVKEFAPLNGEARVGLWNFICQHDSMVDQVELWAAPDEPLNFALRNPRITREATPLIMGRIVDAEAFLARYPFQWQGVDEALILHIGDPYAEWNNISVSLQDGGMKVIARGTSPDADANAAADHELRLSIPALTTLLFSYRRPDELRQLGMLHGSGAAVAKLERLIPRLQPFFYDMF
ncbi:MAG: GNAT family N-acetyltransferase [Paenibacillus dendritiformis]|uniref:GNAT family N-acetyltransferase n=1 Tax=Paenibacillus dendritiformis TaxID=130049 RepID=UPI00143D2A39|nr:GNAT family N-acetyltransferase [Paenibacillus dendritiformis]MDU5142844.1 GNAT family N-acetyltransferase [Paenibacillus dendritiformis]NKI23114.1 GNAT family N-acetyltransferase [Paenibacillus dendritiformis]NRF96830.1 GNAT family N-acetyltransferase [Paenibacillus dendritiformis]GIO73564.1 acetyltransferase [Paenibacillus dendritiformis]